MRTSAKEALFKKEMVPHMNLLYNYAIKTTGSTDDAKDLLQDTFLKAYRFIDKYEKGTNAKAWLFRIMKNSFINDYRKSSRAPDQVDYDEIAEYYDLVRERTGEGNDLRQQVFDNLLDDEVVKAMESLTEEFRTIIILSDLEGLTYEEIAEILNIPLGTVRSRLHRARKVMQKKLRAFAEKNGYIKSGTAEEEETDSAFDIVLSAA
ncbi:MAG: sigma-70 family RNA polymerase sigma factor [Ignavibacteriales bacterium]|nr:sigma-70 family RNA polymerase sigma factor [Ignavibacteriales bacterium]